MKILTYTSETNRSSSNGCDLRTIHHSFKIWNLDALDPIDYNSSILYLMLNYSSIYPRVKMAHEE